MIGELARIYIAGAAGVPMVQVAAVALEAGRGLLGDRYHIGTGTFSQKLKGRADAEVTLIEQEEIDRFNETHGLTIGPGEFRRNLITRGIRLNDLVGQRFRVGDVLLEGLRLCEPCAHLAGTVSPKVLPGLVHRAGLRASILSDGTVEEQARITTGADLQTG